MADIPDITPTKPLWPTRPDERGGQPHRRRRDGESEPDDDAADKKPRKRQPGDGHIDEYV